MIGQVGNKKYLGMEVRNCCLVAAPASKDHFIVDLKATSSFVGRLLFLYDYLGALMFCSVKRAWVNPG